MKGVKELKTY